MEYVEEFITVVEQRRFTFPLKREEYIPLVCLALYYAGLRVDQVKKMM